MLLLLDVAIISPDGFSTEYIGFLITPEKMNLFFNGGISFL